MIDSLIREVLDNWHDWEGQAAHAAQIAQSDEAYDEEMHSHLAGVLESAYQLGQVAALRAASEYCERRAEMYEPGTPQNNEAAKCAIAISQMIQEGK